MIPGTHEARDCRSAVVRRLAASFAATLVTAALVSGCGAPLSVAALFASPSASATVTATPSQTPTRTATLTPSRTPTPTRMPTQTDTPTPSETPTITSTPTRTQTPSRTPTITLTPTINYPRGVAQVMSNCRFGPGAAYLHEWTLYPGDRVRIIHRNDTGTWVYVDPNTYIDYCWVNASLLEITGDIFSLDIYESSLPYSTLYQPPQSPNARREGDQVVISWQPVWMTEDDYRGYLIEAWVCQGGELVFYPTRWDQTIAFIPDEPGCSEPSHARIYTVEKHGYTRWVTIPWPEPASSPSTP